MATGPRTAATPSYQITFIISSSHLKKIDINLEKIKLNKKKKTTPDSPTKQNKRKKK